MKKTEIARSLLASALIVMVLLWVGCAKKTDEGKVPITTSSEDAKKEYLQGRDLLERSLAQNSIQHFENAVAKDSNFAMAYFLLAQVSPTTKGFLDNMKKATALADKASEGERLMILGFQEGVNGDPTKRGEYYGKLVTLFPNDERAHAVLGNHYYALQNYAKAVEHYSAATKIDSTFAPAYNMLGYGNWYNGDFPAAEGAFKKYIELIPNDPNPYDSYAELLMKMGRFDESITQYEKALAQDPHFSSSSLAIAANLMFKGKPDEAKAQLQKVYDMARDDGERRTALLATTILYVDGGKMDSALSEMDKQYAMAEKIDDVPQMAADLETKADILDEMGKYDDALALYEKSAKMYEGSDLSQVIKENVKLGHHFPLATIALKKKDFKKATSEAEEFQKGAEARHNPNLMRQTHGLAGIIALEQKNYDKAIAELQQANQLNPYTLYRISLAYMGKGDKAKAKEFCEKAAHNYTIPGLNYAFIRAKAEKMLAKM
ncbi:MAG: tetratricopeptide repeat protein [Bacteroidota bacterium]